MGGDYYVDIYTRDRKQTQRRKIQMVLQLEKMITFVKLFIFRRVAEHEIRYLTKVRFVFDNYKLLSKWENYLQLLMM